MGQGIRAETCSEQPSLGLAVGSMAARRPLRCTLLAAAAAWLMLSSFSPSFVGLQQTPRNQPRTSLRASEICEIFVTNPSVGMRTRMSVTPETAVETIITDARKALGFDQSWIADSDFKLYKKEDESTPIKGKMGDNDLKPWAQMARSCTSYSSRGSERTVGTGLCALGGTGWNGL